MKSLLSALSITVCTVTAAMTGGAAVSTAQAQSFQPAIVFDMGGKFDKSFNEAAYNGAERSRRRPAIEYREFEVTNETQREQALRTHGPARRQRRRSPSASPRRPRWRRSRRSFPRPSSRSSTASSSSRTCSRSSSRSTRARSWSACWRRWRRKTGKVGFVGGMDIPLIRNFAVRLRAGRQVRQPEGRDHREHDRHDAGRLERPGPRRRAGQEPVRSRRRRGLRRGRRHRHRRAAGGGRRGKLSIGVDSNQNHLHPGTVLTSMLKRVDVAVYNSFKTAKDGTWKAGIPRPRPEGGRRRLGARRQQQVADHRRHEGARSTRPRPTSSRARLQVQPY